MPADAKLIVVTGAAGFVGSHLVREFSAQGYDVIAADRRAEGLRCLAALPGVSLRAGDLTDARYCADLLADVHGVIHCAGVSRVSSAVNAPLDALQSTVLASGNLFAALRQRGNTWLVVVSTREVETLLANPTGVSALADLYGVCKLTVEQLARSFCLDSGIPLVICRLSDVYGSANDHANKLLPTFLERSLAGDPLEIRDTTTRFCFTHINDVVAGISGAVHELSAGHLTYQLRRIWGERWVTAPELAQLIKEVLASDSKLRVSTSSPTSTLAPCISLPHDEGTWHFVEGVPLEEGLKRMSALRG